MFSFPALLVHLAVNINMSLGNFLLSICPYPGPYRDDLPTKAPDDHLAYQAGKFDQLIHTFGGDQVILVKSPPGWKKTFIWLELDKCKSLSHIVDVVIVHGIMKASCRIYQDNQLGCWTREGYEEHQREYAERLAEKFCGRGQED
jgi:hypothetical protein